MRNLVLLPGFMCDQNLWAAMRDGLATLGHLHFGDLSRDDTIEDMATRVLAGAPEKFVLIGFSMGGYVAQAMLRTAPERVAGLILLNTSARGQPPEEIGRNRDRVMLAQRYPFKGQTQRALAQALHPRHANDTALLDRLQAMTLTLGKDVFLRQLALVRKDGHAGLGNIRCPSLVVASRDDQMRTLEETEEMARCILHSTLVIVDDCGHMTPLERPAELLSVIAQWLDHKL